MDRGGEVAHRDVSLIPLQLGEIIVEALEEGLPQSVGARSAARPLQIRAVRQRGELVSHLDRVLQIPVMQKVVVAPHLLLLRVRVPAENVQQRDVVSLGWRESGTTKNEYVDHSISWIRIPVKSYLWMSNFLIILRDVWDYSIQS